jgi:hypothetical protein
MFAMARTGPFAIWLLQCRPKTRPAPEGAGQKFWIGANACYELAFNTVTARRFCDQHEMSLQTATGRSLP